MSDLKSKLAAGVRAAMEQQGKPAPTTQAGDNAAPPADKAATAPANTPTDKPATPPAAKKPAPARRRTAAKPSTATSEPAEQIRRFPRRRVWPD